MSERPTDVSVSVIVPCYNKAPYLRETLASVLAQTVPPHEVVVVDDGSTDGSADIAESFGAPVRVIRQPNRGESVARNRAIEASSGEWVALLDADDVWAPDKLERQLAAARSADFDPVCVYADVYLFDDSGERFGEHRKPEYHAMEDWVVRMLCDWSINPSSSVLRRDALDGVRFPEEVRHSEDMLFFLELRARGRFLRVPETLVGYRRNDRSQTESPEHKLESVRARWGWFAAHRDRYEEGEEDEVRRCLAGQLIPSFSRALWTTRQVKLARACRELYREIHPEPERGATSMRARIYPRWMYRLYDLLRDPFTRGEAAADR